MGLTGFLTLLVGVSLSLNIYERIIRRQNVRMLRQTASELPALIEKACEDLKHQLEAHAQLTYVAQCVQEQKYAELSLC